MGVRASSMLGPSVGFSNQKSERLFIICLALSLLIHALIMFFAYRLPTNLDHKVNDLSSIDINVVETPRTAAETLQRTEAEAPKDAKFESSRNLKADEETSPTASPMDMPNRGGAQKQIAKPKAKAQPKTQGTLFTMSQKELLADSEAQETLTADGQGIDSTGFLQRLKRGEMLKINAGQSDYAQFIKRMKEKLIQHWSPQKIVSTEMYRYNEVRVDVAVILNSAGEIVELRVLQGSRFQRYDDESLRALREAGPFPNPHKSLIQDDGLVYMPWTFTLYMGGAGAGAGIE